MRNGTSWGIEGIIYLKVLLTLEVRVGVIELVRQEIMLISCGLSYGYCYLYYFPWADFTDSISSWLSSDFQFKYKYWIELWNSTVSRLEIPARHNIP
jgi:hypothetical protein